MLLGQAVAILCRSIRCSVPSRIATCLPKAGKWITLTSSENSFGATEGNHGRGKLKFLLSAQAALVLGMYPLVSFADDASNESRTREGRTLDDFSSLRKIEDGSELSNEHTSKWRIFTDNGRDYFQQGHIEQAEKFFRSALQEAREGFGERDPHVAAAYNNLAELYRVKKDFDNAEPLYVEAIRILEEHFGTDDIRVGAAFHNLGQFYLLQRKLDKARPCYERALKIKRRVLGEAHPDYADTMYHLAQVMHLLGMDKDAEDLILNSIRILEAGGQGESVLCIRRTQYLARLYSKSNRLAEAEALLRKILHVVELSKGWKSLDTVVSAERLALILETEGKLKEAEELLERCLDARKNLLPEGHIQNAANILYIARVKILRCEQIMKENHVQALRELNAAENFLHASASVAREIVVRSVERKENQKLAGPNGESGKDASVAIVILLQSLSALGSLELMRLKFLDSKKKDGITEKANAVLRQCISTFKEFGAVDSISQSAAVRAEYLTCLRRLLNDITSSGIISEVVEKEIRDEIRRIEAVK